jgi:hypothetical protein
VVNRGFGGYFTGWLVDYTLEQLFNVANPTMAILFLGTKDTLTQAVSGSVVGPGSPGCACGAWVGSSRARALALACCSSRAGRQVHQSHG